jgi:two-component system chemotaxis sensor kinase CheA
MSDEIDQLWRAFFSEFDEHMEALDTLLSRGDAVYSRNDIAALFRGFHSIKGLSQAMDLMNLQAVAHRVEDLLGLVREGRAPLDEPTSVVLLEAIDRLREMRETVETRRRDAPPQPELVARVGQLVRAIEEGGGAAAPAAGRAVEAVVAAPAAVQVPGSPAGPALTDDEDMLSIYCELLGEQVASFTDALVSGDGAMAGDGAEELVHGAAVIGFDRLAEDLQRVAVAARALPDPVARSSLVVALSQLRAQLALIEEMSGTQAGARALADGLAAHARAEAGPLAARLLDLLTAVDIASPGSLEAATGAATDVRAVLESAGMRQAAGSVLLLEEQVSRAGQGDVAWTKALAELAADIVGVVGSLEKDLTPEEAAALQAVWQVRMHETGDAAAPQRECGLATALPPELRQSLTGGQLAALEKRAAEGWHAFDLVLDTETEPEVASDLATWLSAHTEVITTRTVTAGAMNWFEFLFVSQQALEPVQAALTAVDPEQRCMRGLREIVTPGAAAADPGVAGVAEGSTPKRDAGAGAVIRVRVEAIETLMDGLDEMRVTLGGLGDSLAGLRAALAKDGVGRAVLERLEAAEALRQRVEAMHRHARAACIELRVVPVETVFARFPRLVRELATKLGREVEFELTGRDARLDKSMADLLVDPMMHLLRNALDHGIEPPEERVAAGKRRRARLTVSASEHADGVHIAVRDDGRGLNRAAIHRRAMERGLVAAGVELSDQQIYELLLRSGFSTAAQVTEISGRGVGLDVVAYTLSRIGGTIEIETQTGQGTCFTMRVPASASLQDVLLVDAGELVAIPQRRVVSATIIESIDVVGGERIIWQRGAPVPLFDLADLLGFARPERPAEAAVIVSDGGRWVALAVGGIPQRREVFLKELHPMLAGLPTVSGATLMSDGSAVIVLDVDGVLDRVRAAQVAVMEDMRA